jgi:hypothetical protein
MQIIDAKDLERRFPNGMQKTLLSLRSAPALLATQHFSVSKAEGLRVPLWDTSRAGTRRGVTEKTATQDSI